MPNSADLLKKLAESEDDADLLDGLNDDDGAEAWVPENPGEGIQGTVISVTDDMPDQYKANETVPVVTIETADGTHYRIMGFHGVLRKEIRQHAPRVGDTFAVRYFGEKTLKTGPFKGKDFHHYRAAVRRNARTSEEAPF